MKLLIWVRELTSNFCVGTQHVRIHHWYGFFAKFTFLLIFKYRVLSSSLQWMGMTMQHMILAIDHQKDWRVEKIDDGRLGI